MTLRSLKLSIALIICGCAHSRNATVDSSTNPAVEAAETSITESSETLEDVSHLVAPAGFEAVDEAAQQSGVEIIPTVEERSPSVPEIQESEAPEWWGVGNEAVLLEHVIASVYQSYPLLESALYSRTIAAGEQLAASGAFDLKLKAASENGPTGFYQTYRQSVGLVQPIYHGGEAFAGYRIGRGDFQPWYLERQTNGSGEFKAGLAVPLARNRDIDSRRADLWRSNYGRQLVEPDIQAQLIGFVQEASYIYWTWVAAGENVRIADRVLQLAMDRTERISRQVEEGLLDPPELTDNLRLVAERRGKLADAERKFQQTAIKLSLYYRDLNGAPLVPSPKSLPAFPDPLLTAPESLNSDIQIALEQRPEMYVLNMIRRQLDVDYAESQNDLRPNIDAVVAGSQDIGEPTSSKNDKGQFELDASIFVDVPLQRRKAQGKMQAIQAKIAQLSAKRRLTEDKIVTDVQSAYAGLVSAYEQVQQAQEAVEYAEDLARRERLNFEQGASDLLKVTLREQYAAEAAAKVVDARLLYFQTQADYRAALAQDRLP
ncbi:MAG: TolC family protein [Planctomycetaceae bacterium]|nr:TolC family protein [Planctomycetaceae bacterium]